MAVAFIKDPYPLEWICKLWVENVAEGRDVRVMKDSINQYVVALEALSPTASSVSMATGAIHYCNSDLIKAREELMKG